MCYRQERAELHRAIWNIANDLRGSVDGWDFKQIVAREDELQAEIAASIVEIEGEKP